MVDMDNVLAKLRRGMFTGVGAFASTIVGDQIEQRFGLSNVGVSAATLAVGVGTSVAADEFIDRRSSIPNDVVEFAGYGMQGSAWAELADEISSGSAPQTGARVVNVTANASEQSSTNESQSEGSRGTFSIDV